MSDEQKTAAAPVDPNAEAAKDVQNVLAELKAEEAKAGEAKADETAKKDATEEKESAAADETAEEAKIVAAAAKLGEDSEKKETKGDTKIEERGPGGPKGGRGGRPNYRNNIKSNLTSQEPSSDPVAIRKQVSLIPDRVNGPSSAHLTAMLC